MAIDYELEIDKLLNDGSHTIRSLARELLEFKLEKIPILQEEIRNLKAERTHASSDWEEKSAVYTDSEYESTTEGSSAAIVSCPDYAVVYMYDLTFSSNLSCFGIHSIGSRSGCANEDIHCACMQGMAFRGPGVPLSGCSPALRQPDHRLRPYDLRKPSHLGEPCASTRLRVTVSSSQWSLRRCP